jgi:hypothetical protein
MQVLRKGGTDALAGSHRFGYILVDNTTVATRANLKTDR